MFGLTLAMLEDSLEPEKTGMTRDKFNFYNLTKMALFKDPDPDNPFGTLREYCNGRDKLSKVPSLTGVVVNNAPNTSKSYMGVLQPKLSVFQDIGICYATAESEMSFDDFTDQPTVLFIKVPDEQESRHCIATMCISQLYKKLIETAGKRTNLSLARPVHFLLDEFANLPKIEKWTRSSRLDVHVKSTSTWLFKVIHNLTTNMEKKPQTSFAETATFKSILEQTIKKQKKTFQNFAEMFLSKWKTHHTTRMKRKMMEVQKQQALKWSLAP